MCNNDIRFIFGAPLKIRTTLKIIWEKQSNCLIVLVRQSGSRDTRQGQICRLDASITLSIIAWFCYAQAIPVKVWVNSLMSGCG